MTDSGPSAEIPAGRTPNCIYHQFGVVTASYLPPILLKADLRQTTSSLDDIFYFLCVGAVTKWILTNQPPAYLTLLTRRRWSRCVYMFKRLPLTDPIPFAGCLGYVSAFASS